MSGPDERLIIAARRLIAHMADILEADLCVRLWNGEILPLGPGARDDLRIAINDPRAITRLLRRPRIETAIDLYARGDLDIEGGTILDVAARRGTMRTRGLFRRLDKRLALRALAPFLFARAGGQKAIGQESGAAFGERVEARADRGRDDRALVGFHYDLSNDFYQLFLDERMVYTCAYFEREDATLDEAQEAKLDMICRKLRLVPGDRFLDIGCGWGALVIHAARHYGVQAHGVTLSREQQALAVERIAREGLAGRVSVELRDYRSLDAPESYDKIASIGMFEHVGIDNHDIYFAQMRRLLRPRGLYLHHAIARPSKANMRRFRAKRAEYRALTTYIFPGGELDSLGMSINGLERNGFEVHDVEGWRENYARTCRAWAQRLDARKREAIEEVGAPRARLWLLYLAGCALAFERGAVGVFQTLASRRDKGPSGLPLTRADLYASSSPGPASAPAPAPRSS